MGYLVMDIEGSVDNSTITVLKYTKDQWVIDEVRIFVQNEQGFIDYLKSIKPEWIISDDESWSRVSHNSLVQIQDITSIKSYEEEE